MDLSQVEQKIQKLFEENFPGEVYSDQLVRSECAYWDSIRHVQFLFEIEKQFGIRFSGSEASALDSIKKIIAKVGDHGS